ncbi:MAG: RpiB/LacA/LacB family sugar-phosphate isomerase [Butyrivibrio sp.]|nr:RpiB/LacA/LacB family sugar-phosphate isomerase [Butyrivibrio sp.]
MKIAVIQASSQAEKNEFIYETVKKYAKDSEVINFGCFLDDDNKYSYIDISILIGMLLYSGSVDFVVTGCSSGQGMMLACNNMPGVLCGYAYSPMDAYLFVQINNGNAISLPLGEEYTFSGYDNLEYTIAKMFSEPFAQGYPKSEAARKLKDTEKLKNIRMNSQVDMLSLLDTLDEEMIQKIISKKDVVAHICACGKDDIVNWIQSKR